MGTKQFDNYADLITFTRASSGTYLDSDGVLKTATTNTPRIEYDADGNRLGLLIEEARTNLALYSQDLNDAVWTKTDFGTGAGAPTVTANHAIAPDGTMTADLIEFPACTESQQSSISQSNLVTAGVTYSGTFWARAASGSVTNLVRRIAANIEIVVPLTEEWTRISVDNVVGVVSEGIQFKNRPFSSGDGSAFSIYIWGAQLEAGSFPTSYIPTSGAAATRAADVTTMPTSAFGYNQTAGTVVCEFERNETQSARYIMRIDNGSYDNSLNILSGIANPRQQRFDAVVENTVQASIAFTTSVETGVFLKTAVAFSANDFATALNGTITATDTAGSIPSANILRLGGVTGGSNVNGHLKSFQYYPRRLTNAQLEELTA